MPAALVLEVEIVVVAEAEVDQDPAEEAAVIDEMREAVIDEEIEVTREAVRLHRLPTGPHPIAIPDGADPEAEVEIGTGTLVVAIIQTMIGTRNGILEFHRIN